MRFIRQSTPPFILSVALIAGCAVRDRNAHSAAAQPPARAAAAESKPRLFKGMGDHKRKVTTSSPQAQRYFDQGLTWTYAFNHDEAIRSFEEAARLDPDCAMAWWGFAVC